METLLEKIENEPRMHARLSDFIKIKHGFAFKGEYFSVRPTKDVLVTPGNFAIGGGFKADKYKYYAGAVPEDYILKTGDLVVTMTDLSVDADTLGYSALIPNDSGVQFLHNQRVGLVQQIKEGVDLGFLNYLMRTREYQSYIVGGASGSTVKHTSPDRIASFEYDFPSVPMQRKIAEILSAYDEKIENNKKIIQNLETAAQTIFDEWFVAFRFPRYEKVKMIEGGVEEIPEGWEEENVLDVIERIGVGKKYDNKSALPTGKVQILDQGKSGNIGYHNDEPGVMASIENPVVVFTNHTCYYRLMTEPFSCIQNVLPYIGKNGYPTLFIYFLTKEKIKMQEYKGHWPDFEEQKFIVPPAKLANDFVEKITPLIVKMVACEKESAILKESRDRLLAKLI
jgi:type I restriction enzyme S subunit